MAVMIAQQEFHAYLLTSFARYVRKNQQNLLDNTTRKNQIQEIRREIAKLELQLVNNSQIISQYSGRILEIAIAPGQVISSGTRLGTINSEDSSSKMVGVTYFPVSDGKKIQPGMTIQITPQTVKRQRFGGILGNVTSVSEFHITKEAAANEVGNAEVVESLVSRGQEGLMQAYDKYLTGFNTSGKTPFIGDRLPVATVKAIGDCLVLSIPRQKLAAKLQQDIRFADRVYRAIASLLDHRLQEMYSQLGYGRRVYSQGQLLNENGKYEDELDIDALDCMALSGKQLDWMLRMLTETRG